MLRGFDFGEMVKTVCSPMIGLRGGLEVPKTSRLSLGIPATFVKGLEGRILVTGRREGKVGVVLAEMSGGLDKSEESTSTGSCFRGVCLPTATTTLVALKA